MDWVHCNSCFAQPGPGLAFCLTNCGHMYCSSCLNIRTDLSKEICKICKKDCKYIQLVPEMKSEAKQYFKEPDEIVGELMNVLDFQKHHRMRLITYWKSTSKKYLNAKLEIQRLRENMEKMLAEMKNLNRENHYLKTELKNLKNQEIKTPPVFRTPKISPSSTIRSWSGSAKKGRYDRSNYMPSNRSFGGASTFLTPISMPGD